MSQNKRFHGSTLDQANIFKKVLLHEKLSFITTLRVTFQAFHGMFPTIDEYRSHDLISNRGACALAHQRSTIAKQTW